jgi:hypothetical protein
VKLIKEGNKMKRTISSLLVFVFSFLVGCSHNHIASKPSISFKPFQIEGQTIFNSKLSKIVWKLDDLLLVKVPIQQQPKSKWESIDRLRYVQGKVISFRKVLDGKLILSLKIEKNFHDGTDPVGSPDYPFKIGKVIEFFLEKQPNIDLTKIKRVIVYESDVTTNRNNSFLGAIIKYYEFEGKFYDLTGLRINLPLK